MELNRTPNELDRSARNKENENWDKIEGNLEKIGNSVNDFIGTVTSEVVNELVDKAKLDWKEPVNNFNSLPTNAEIGETRMTKDNGNVYRYNGTDWEYIQQIDAGPVNELDSRLTSQLNDKANISDLSDKFTEVKFNIVTHEMEFYAGDVLIEKVDISEAGNANAVHDYIDSLVNEGLIEGVSVADNSLDTSKYQDKSVTRDKLSDDVLVNTPWLTEETDLDYIMKQGNWIVDSDAKNKPFPGQGFLIVNRGKTDWSRQGVYVTQEISALGSNPEKHYRLFQYNESTGQHIIIRPWKRIDNLDIREIVDEVELVLKDKLKSGVIDDLNLRVSNLNWAQLNNNLNITEGEFVYYTESQGVHNRTNDNFVTFSELSVQEGDVYRIVTRLPDTFDWSINTRGIMLDDNDEFVKFIEVDNGEVNSGFSTFIIPKYVTKVIVNGRKTNDNQSRTHILKLCRFENIKTPKEIGFTADSQIKNDGTIIATENDIAVTDTVNVAPGQIYRIANAHTGSGASFLERGVFLDDSNNIVAPLPNNTKGTLPYAYNDVIVPFGATKMRINFYLKQQTRDDTSNSVTISEAVKTKPKYSSDYVHLLDEKVAFYGDSTTWYAGCIRMIQDATGIKPYINGYSGASLTTKHSDNTLTDDTRINQLLSSDSEIIIINGGLNDSNGVELGDTADFKVSLGEEDKSTFYGAYSYIIKKILTEKPSAKLILWTTTFWNYNNSNDGSTPNNSLDYARATKEVAEYFGIPIADVRQNMQANWYTNDIYLSDNIHHSFRGDEAVARTILKELKNIN